MTIKTHITRYLAIAAVAFSLLTPTFSNFDLSMDMTTPAGLCPGGTGGSGTGC